ncbi:MAG: tRNA (adenosine(37)-N6)-threonylcarbamoyltransferase complex ATPase subunit type 1 TsaE [Rikenellaceae bacterium]
MEKTYFVKNLNDLSGVAREIIGMLLESEKESRVVLFHGEMGAGKTTLIREMCEAAGVEDTVTSPTFAIVNEYATTDNQPIYHFDFYRIESLREVYDLGYEEYFFSGNLCLVEWPSKIDPIIDEIRKSDGVCEISIEVDERENRIIEFSHFGENA